MPSTSQLRSEISGFLAGIIDASLPGAGAVAGQPALSDLSGDDSGLHCRCTVAVAVSVGSSASAVAIPGAGPAGSGAAAVHASSQNIGGDVPQAEITGSTGNATSVSVSGDGPASSVANTGSVGTGTSAGASIGHHISPAGAVNLASLAVVTADFEHRVLSDVGPAATALDALSCPTLLCGAPAAASVDVEAYVPNGSTCTATDSAEWCTIAIAISVGGHAHASVSAPAGAYAPSCTTGRVGRPTAIAIAAKGPASALAHAGAGGGTCPAAPSGSTGSIPVKATSGSSGNALSIALAQHGPSGANATSGNAGQVRAITDGSGNGLLTSSATATTGDTGDAVGISVGRTAANALVHSGSSGRAAALCTHCSLAGNDTVAEATTGHTGGSYSLAVAGKEAFSNALSGDSGDAASWAVHGTAETFLTGQDTQSTPDSVVKTGDSGRVYVVGRSGDTGNVVATATDLLTWVSVLTQSGNAGPVTSTASWNADGCTLIFATFTMQCAAVGQPHQGPTSLVPTGQTPGSQTGPKAVVSASEPGVIVVARGTNTTKSTGPAPAVQLGLDRKATGAQSDSVSPAAASTAYDSGQATDLHGGARTRLVSNEVARPAVSTTAFGPLTSWWGLLTLCVTATFLVALIYIACRYGRPRNMNTG